MPLPASSKPGETTRIALHPRQSTLPKHAIVVRLNSEAMNALDSFPNQPQLDIDLGNDSPGLYIGGSFFPALFQKEEISHEIYIRAATANKPNAPLRCHANVVGKISLTDRELDPHLEARIRSKHKDAVEQRNAPKTKYIDTPPDLPPPAATSRPRKKDVSMWRKPVKPSDQPRSFPPAGTSHPRQTSSNQMSAEAMALRKQLIHHLAASDPEEPTVEDVLRAVGPEECDIVTRRRITDSLAEVAEQNAAKRWVLKPSCWKEVRPYDWPKLSEVERTQMARKGRIVLSKLGITEADEIWSHFKFRSTQTASSSQPTNGQPAAAPKRGIMSTEVKDKKSRPVKAMEIPAKEENRGKPLKNESRSGPTSTRPPQNQQVPPTTVPTKRSVPPTLSASPSPALPARPSPIARKPPGSGFKLKSGDSSRRSESLSQDGSPAPTAAPVRTKGEPGRNPEKSSVASSSNGRDRLDDIDAPPPKRVKRLKEEAGVESEREYESSRDRNRDRERERDRNREGVRDPAADRRRERDREPDRERERDRGRERERERAERDRRREREKARAERGRESDFESDRDKERAKEKNRTQRPSPTMTASKEPPNRLSNASSPLKRKKPLIREEGEDDTDEWSMSKSSAKKRRMENDSEPPIPIANGSSSRDRPQKTNKALRDSIPSSLPKKPVDVTPPSQIVVKKEKPKEMSPLAQLPKIKKEPSPMPNPRMASSSSKAPSTLKTSAKSRRKSFDYTSSEEEEEGAIRTTSSAGSSTRNHNYNIMPSPPMSTPSHFPNGPSRSSRPTAASSSTASAPGTTSLSASREREPSPLPTDHAGLRARYSSSYVSYLDTFRTAMTQKSKIESLLQSYGESSVASVTDSDGEELLDYDRLTQVVGETKRRWDELQGIQQAYETSAKS
ncbi:hypothetical protein PM082_001535 [Marasmius tenuissimus]|nr:hypothetical protein PM082_001535 [Marasmius tenuissimus]